MVRTGFPGEQPSEARRKPAGGRGRIRERPVEPDDAIAGLVVELEIGGGIVLRRQADVALGLLLVTRMRGGAGTGVGLVALIVRA